MTPPKRYKFYWNLANLWTGIQPEVVKLQHLWLAAVATAGGTTWAQSDANVALIVAGGGALVNTFVIGCIYIEEIK